MEPCDACTAANVEGTRTFTFGATKASGRRIPAFAANPGLVLPPTPFCCCSFQNKCCSTSPDRGAAEDDRRSGRYCDSVDCVWSVEHRLRRSKMQLVHGRWFSQFLAGAPRRSAKLLCPGRGALYRRCSIGAYTRQPVAVVVDQRVDAERIDLNLITGTNRRLRSAESPRESD